MKKNLKDCSKNELGLEFVSACRNGNIELVDYILTSPELENKPSVSFKSNLGLIEACWYGHLNIVKYLLSSDKLKEHADIHAKNEYPFLICCQLDYIDMVKYLGSSPELKEHSDVHKVKNQAFKDACRKNNYEILSYLIIDMGIEKSKGISDFLKSNPNPDAENMFELKMFQQKLKYSLNNDTQMKSKKIKV